MLARASSTCLHVVKNNLKTCHTAFSGSATVRRTAPMARMNLTTFAGLNRVTRVDTVATMQDASSGQVSAME